MHCSNCNVELAEDKQFCTNCGQKIKIAKSLCTTILSKIGSVARFFTKKTLMLISLVVLLLFIFYWFSYLPKQYRADCYKSAIGEAGGYQNTKSKIGMERYENAYKKCLTSHGLN